MRIRYTDVAVALKALAEGGDIKRVEAVLRGCKSKWGPLHPHVRGEQLTPGGAPLYGVAMWPRLFPPHSGLTFGNARTTAPPLYISFVKAAPTPF